tara:strand:+ start:81 stop:602 length:522 start_codon:yes stop_codon:yes gene_type:complete
MIITCNNCIKTFDVDPSLIPENGRLLQCSSCEHKWFFKKENINDPIIPIDTYKSAELVKPSQEKLISKSLESPESIDLLDNEINKDPIIEKTLDNKGDDNISNKNLQIEQSENKKNYNILGPILVFIISFIALIIVFDTFQGPISKIVPNIEFLLYSLYETINDIKLFLIDLI